MFFRYDFSHIRTPAQQLVFNKQEIKPTPISLPTPPASPEFWGTSLQKWYQKKPLFTLTAKGQVKRLEKYLQIQKTLEMCKKEYEFVVHTDNMKKAYLDFEFREHQPLLYEDKDYCCVCPCNSSRRYDIDFIPVDYISCSSPNPKLCICSDEDQEKIFEKKSHKTVLYSVRQSPNAGTGFDNIEPNHFRNRDDSIGEEKIIPTKIIREGEKDPDDRGIYKIIVKNKELPNIPSARYVMKLYDNKKFKADENIYCMTETFDAFHEKPNNKENGFSGLSKITLDNIQNLPFDFESNLREPRSEKCHRKTCPNFAVDGYVEMDGLSSFRRKKCDINKNVISSFMDIDSCDRIK